MTATILRFRKKIDKVMLAKNQEIVSRCKLYALCCSASIKLELLKNSIGGETAKF